MKKKAISVKPAPGILLAFLCFVLFTISAYSQEVAKGLSDTIKMKTIPVADIPIAFGKTKVTSVRIAQSLISDQQIKSLTASSRSFLNTLDSSLKKSEETYLYSLNDRYLANQLSIWIDNKKLVKKEIEKLSAISRSLKAKHDLLAEESRLWMRTRYKFDSVTTTSNVRSIIAGVISHTDSIDKLITGKIDKILELTIRTVSYELQIEDFTNKIGSILEERQSHLFSKSFPSFLKVTIADRTNWQIKHYFHLFYEHDILVFKRFYQNNEGLFFLYFTWIIVLIILFQFFKRSVNKLNVDSFSAYEAGLKKILIRSVSAALILGLFSSVLFFPNRPLILNDISVIIVSVPLIIIVLNLIDHNLRKYFYLLWAILLLRFLNYLIPPELYLHRSFTMVIGISEILVFIALVRYFSMNRIKNPLIHGSVLLLLMVHLVIAVIGIAGNFYGSVRMADIAVNMVITNAFIGLLLFISAVIVIGLLHFAIDSKYFKRLNFVRDFGPYLKSRVIGITLFVAIFFWLSAILMVLGILDNISDNVREFLTRKYGTDSASFTIGGILLFFFVIWCSVVISKIVRVVLEEDVLSRMSLKKGVPRLISVMARYTLLAIGVFIAVSVAGLQPDRLTIILGAFSVGIGFGLQNIFNNLVSGLILLFERPIQIGDVVEVGTLKGEVRSMGIRSSNLRTFDGAEVIVPNGHLISNEVVNWTLSDKKRRMEVLSGVAYGSDVHKVQKLLLKLLEDHPDVLKDPAPNVYFNDMGESSLDFRLLFWIDNYDQGLRIRSEVIFKIHDVLREEGIEIPFPQRDLHIRSIKGKSDI